MAAAVPPLSPREVAFFVREGYLIRRQQLDPALLEEAQQTLLATADTEAPPPWVGGFSEADSGADAAGGFRQGQRWFCKVLRPDAVLLDLVARRCTPLAEQLLGAGRLVEVSPLPVADTDGPKRSDGTVGIGQHLRGVMCQLPERPDAPRLPQRGCHIVRTRAPPAACNRCVSPGYFSHRRRCVTLQDAHPFSLCCVTYLWDTPPGAGAFTVWPRSHRRVFHEFPWQFSSRHDDRTTIAGEGGDQGPMAELVEAIKDDTVPVALHARAGDCIFWHHRYVPVCSFLSWLRAEAAGSCAFPAGSGTAQGRTCPRRGVETPRFCEPPCSTTTSLQGSSSAATRSTRRCRRRTATALLRKTCGATGAQRRAPRPHSC